MSIHITNCFGIGYRCVTDKFMKGLNIRKYSSPFSYMICDLETSIEFIINNFEDYLNVTLILDDKFKYNNNKWYDHLFFNNKFKLEETDIEISSLKRICVWNHHDLNNIEIINSIKGRYLHLLDADKLSNILYIYIDNIQNYTSDNWEDYFKKEIVLNFINMNINRYILLLLPLLNYNFNPTLYKINPHINVIFYESNTDDFINDYESPKIKWNLINKLVLENYSFSLAPSMHPE